MTPYSAPIHDNKSTPVVLRWQFPDVSAEAQGEISHKPFPRKRGPSASAAAGGDVSSARIRRDRDQRNKERHRGMITVSDRIAAWRTLARADARPRRCRTPESTAGAVMPSPSGGPVAGGPGVAYRNPRDQILTMTWQAVA